MKTTKIALVIFCLCLDINHVFSRPDIKAKSSKERYGYFDSIERSFIDAAKDGRKGSKYPSANLDNFDTSRTSNLHPKRGLEQEFMRTSVIDADISSKSSNNLQDKLNDRSQQFRFKRCILGEPCKKGTRFAWVAGKSFTVAVCRKATICPGCDSPTSSGGLCHHVQCSAGNGFLVTTDCACGRGPVSPTIPPCP